MNKVKPLFFLILFVAVLLLASLQRAPGFSFFGIVPGLLIAFLIPLSFFIEDFYQYFALIIFGSALAQPRAGINLISFVILGTFLVSWWVRRKFLVQSLYSNFLAITFATLLVYLFIAPSFILSWAFLLELLYNEVIATVFFGIFWRYKHFLS
ncbi:MAG: hypothetical protein COU09_01390 [Candidatus Harrisonbacteria bacterium CG10_big_fil_rev_8_21_14_0_10_44_23]|uniref:Rod shape-determining protein MreD n=1 Tax=Candidatus Harrisonbacteria bacterium CG10_big_fil_rev_8_21_14_0_10_44_23 TaxID=1974585 RepID=A0A2H0UQA9_9BACT|nr:MAG: hypothetical protein COU09_01390 [Candidatus Harrisonbacteria bacterium CG10_big_fil_rev_8_21_14_0_10_44_23]